MHDDNRDRARAQLKRRRPPTDRVKVDGTTYKLVGEEERVDREWESEEAKRRREVWSEGQDERLAERQARRSRLTLGQRLDHALGEIELGKGNRARPIAAQRGSSEGSLGGNRPPRVSGPELVEHSMRLILHHVATIERQLDAELGLVKREPIGDRPGMTGAMAAGRLMSTEERDRIVWEEFAGVRSEQVAAEAPYLGTSARTIERARAAEAARRGVCVRLVDGVVLEEEQAAA